MSKGRETRGRFALASRSVAVGSPTLPPAASEAQAGAVAAPEATEPVGGSVVARVLGDGVPSVQDANLLRRGLAEGWIGPYAITAEVRGEMLDAARRMLADAQASGSARATRAALRLLRVLVRDNVALAQVDAEVVAAAQAAQAPGQTVNVAIQFDDKG